jgi:hypothetical protein
VTSCEDVRGRLDDFVDGELEEAAFQEVELHLASCAECRAQEAELRELLREARALPHEIEPPAELWDGVAARIRSQEAPRVLAFPQARRRLLAPVLAAAAAVLLAVLASLRSTAPAPPAPVALLPQAEKHLLPASAGDQALDSEREYVRVTAELLSTLEQRQDTVSPETLAAVRENLATIDDALHQIREALLRDPGSAQLSLTLATTHQRKINVLRRIVRLSS